MNNQESGNDPQEEEMECLAAFWRDLPAELRDTEYRLYELDCTNCPGVYTCLQSGEDECIYHGGFDNCCGHPDCPGNRS